MRKPRTLKPDKKIPEIEGVRALAILLVLSFHFVVRWAPPIYPKNLYPYHLEALNQISQFGFMGVQLFFMVSGFVILRSLEHQKNFKEFVMARVKRLYPSLFLTIPFIFIVCNLLDQSFIAPIPISSLVPSLTLISPDFLNYLFSIKLTWTTGVLWTLFIEMQFYLIAGLIHFKTRKLTFVTKFLLLTLSLQIIKAATINVFHQKSAINSLLPIINYMWWFLAGSAFWRIKKQPTSVNLKLVTIFSLIVNLIILNYGESSPGWKPIPSIIILLFYLIFYFLSADSKITSFLKIRPLVLLGGISYELYLVHESVGVSVIARIRESMHSQMNSSIALLILAFLTASLILFSTLMKCYSELFFKFVLKNFLRL